MKRLITILFFMTACFAVQAACPATDRKDTLEITPEVFGCVGDGITDDTEGLQKAFDYCRTHNRLLRSQKGKIYAVSKTIMVHTQSDIQVDFGGAIIMAVKPMEHIIDIDNLDIPERIAHSSTVYNLVLDCNSMSGGIYCTCACKVTFNSLMIRNCSLKAFRIKRGSEVILCNSHIHCTTGPESYGIYMDTGDCHFDNIVIVNAHTAIFQLTSINFYDNVHAWMSKNVEGSVFVHLVDGLAHFGQSYCDTAEKGYVIDGPSVLRLTDCYYFNNPRCYDSKNPPVIFYFTKPELTEQATISIEGSSFNSGGLDVRISNEENHHIQANNCYFNPGISGNLGKFNLTAAPGVTFRRAYGSMGDNTRFASPLGDANKLYVDADIESPAKGKVVVCVIPEAYAPSSDQYGLSTVVGSKGETVSVPVLVEPSGEVSFQCPAKLKPVRVVVDMEYVH